MAKSLTGRLSFGLCGIAMVLAIILMVRGGHGNIVSLLIGLNALLLIAGNLAERRPNDAAPPDR
jgi:hypothetical protein